MNTVFEGEVLDILPVENGIILSYCEEKMVTQMVVAFKMISFDTGRVTNVAKNIFQLSKFGPDYKAFSTQVDNYLTCKTILFPSEKMFVLEADGTVKILNADATSLWTGRMIYSGNVPEAVAVFENKLWACFPKKNVLVRYNLNTMREELRIGGGENSPFIEPSDIYVDNGYAYVCNPGTMQILKVDLNTYSLSVYKEFEFPVKKYMKSGQYSFVVTDTAVYLLD